MMQGWAGEAGGGSPCCQAAMLAVDLDGGGAPRLRPAPLRRG